MERQQSATYLVIARSKSQSLSVGVASAGEALRKVQAFRACGRQVVVLDHKGSERSEAELRMLEEQERDKA